MTGEEKNKRKEVAADIEQAYSLGFVTAKQYSILCKALEQEDIEV